ncbi:DUF6387 family protein [Azotobacter vinelandii]|uniref:DUF6387 family protein n=1 Tax=Azotobacter vinelandii TaxID=354 RepID=UPI0026662883|nr:DUF6387 family protein [Azotobacter vinelandii]WKN20642.1 DUF6387 family protein [Azotobacter vinelandii]
MAKIDRVEDLPEWFDLEKYQECDKFGAVEWYRLLSIRRDILATLTNGASGMLGSAALLLLGPYLEKQRNFPLDPMPDGCKFWEHVPSASALASHQPVRTLTTSELILQSYLDQDAAEDGICEALLGARWELIAAPGSWAATHEALVADIPLEFRDHYLDEKPTTAVLVDLNSPDTVLLERFAAWLKDARARQPAGVPKRIKLLYNRWARYGLLSYLDLLIWSIETGIHIPDRVMSAAISRHDAGEANLRKTIAPLAAELMRDLSELQALAAVEAAARTPAGEETLES